MKDIKKESDEISIIQKYLRWKIPWMCYIQGTFHHFLKTSNIESILITWRITQKQKGRKDTFHAGKQKIRMIDHRICLCSAFQNAGLQPHQQCKCTSLSTVAVVSLKILARGISWLQFAFPRWLMKLNIFSYIYLPFPYYPLLWNSFSSVLPHFPFGFSFSFGFERLCSGYKLFVIYIYIAITFSLFFF